MAYQSFAPAAESGVPMGAKSRPATPKEARQARGFARWQKAARLRKGWGIPQLATASEYTDTWVRVFDADGDGGIGPASEYKRPSRKYIAAIAAATGADEREGLICAGHLAVDTTDSDDPIRAIAGYRRREIVLPSGKKFFAAIPDDVTDEELLEYSTIAQSVAATRARDQNLN